MILVHVCTNKLINGGQGPSRFAQRYVYSRLIVCVFSSPTLQPECKLRAPDIQTLNVGDAQTRGVATRHDGT